ncbi:hypothetical protein KSP39_PZI014878 [Platanthera zijinensis]|uniref:Uncharacterized protein n=1 Tax=Platanthera zijinensis TaxID=2320716 RepID=A0AAP0G2T1_9ASPA
MAIKDLWPHSTITGLHPDGALVEIVRPKLYAKHVLLLLDPPSFSTSYPILFVRAEEIFFGFSYVPQGQEHYWLLYDIREVQAGSSTPYRCIDSSPAEHITDICSFLSFFYCSEWH